MTAGNHSIANNFYGESSLEYSELTHFTAQYKRTAGKDVKYDIKSGCKVWTLFSRHLSLEKKTA